MKESFAYRPIIFLQGNEAIEALEILDKKGENALIDYLSQWDNNEGEWQLESDWGTADRVVFKNGYYLSTNLTLGYVGLTSPVTKKQWETRN